MIVLSVLAAVLFLVVVYDLFQKKHAILRNFPVIGHFRYMLERIGPELRQYIVSDNDADRPFSRDQRRWIYASAKAQNSLFGFGTDNDLDLSQNHIIVRHAAFPVAEPHLGMGAAPERELPVGKVLGAARGRTNAFRMPSIVNISSMSYGSLSGPAVTALNKGAALSGSLHGSGEGGITKYHDHGGPLIWQIGTGYFGCRDKQGKFDLTTFLEGVDRFDVRAIEIKLSQGAKPGLGGMLPAKKVTSEIAAIRGIPVHSDCHSPPSHSAFGNVDEMLDFVELLAAETGLPVGIKSAIGESRFWSDLADRMSTTDRGVDFILADGGEGGTGAGPLAFTDHVALPFFLGFTQVYRIFAEQQLSDDIVWIGSGRLGLPDRAFAAMALGVDAVAVGREAMMAAGCVQAQKCHTGHCPTGVTTHSRWLQRGLDPEDKGVRVAAYLRQLRHEIGQIGRAHGVGHPALAGPEAIEFLDGALGSRTGAEVFGYRDGWGDISSSLLADIDQLLSP